MTEEQKSTAARIRDLAPDAAETIAEILHDKNAPSTVRLKAAELVFNRVYGNGEIFSVKAEADRELSEAFCSGWT